MPRFIVELLPPKINCPHCRASLSLDEEERTFKRFKCPACKKKIDLRVQMPEVQPGKAPSPFAKFSSPEVRIKPVPNLTPPFPGPAKAKPGTPPTPQAPPSKLTEQ